MSMRLLAAWLRRKLDLTGKRVPQDDRHLQIHAEPSRHNHVGLKPALAIEPDAIGCQCHREVGADSPDLSEAVHNPYGNAVRVCRVHRVPFVEGGGGFVGQGGSSCAAERLWRAQSQSNQKIDAGALRNVNVFGEARR